MNLFLFFFFIFHFFAISAQETTLKPDYTLQVPMRDGFELPTDIYLPNPTANHLPCILVRSPAGRNAFPWQKYSQLSQLGYVIAIQDTRNALDPEGKTFPYYSDGWGQHQDGYDTVEWLAKHSITNGKIGTIGFSAAGITQLMMAPTAPPSLKCQLIGFAAGNLYEHAIYPGGQALKNQIEGWLGMHAKDTGVLSYVYNQPLYNNFWSEFNTIKEARKVKVPALLFAGWFDTFLQGTLDSFVARQYQGGEGAKGKQKLVIGPWTHYWPYDLSLGDFQVPPQGQLPPSDISQEKWFDYYLKGIKNHIERIPAVTYYVMGPFDGSPSSGNIWRHANQWPVPSILTPFYLTDNHKLIEKELPKTDKSFTYKHDPENPVETLGGHNLFLPSGPRDQRPIENRADVLLFTSDPLDEDLEITGAVSAVLTFSSDSKDTDVVVRLTDVYPDGRSIMIADGIFRTGPMNLSKEENEYKKPQEIHIDLWSTSFVFAKGHRIRVSVSSSNYPRYEKNWNMGLFGSQSGVFSAAHNILHVGKNHLSRLILPVVRKGSRWLVPKPSKI